MTLYFVSAKNQANGDHEVHTEACGLLPEREHCIELGEFPSCCNAVVAATRYFPHVDGCFYCCRECHKS
jgi:hypothetical protein